MMLHPLGIQSLLVLPRAHYWGQPCLISLLVWMRGWVYSQELYHYCVRVLIHWRKRDSLIAWKEIVARWRLASFPRKLATGQEYINSSWTRGSLDCTWGKMPSLKGLLSIGMDCAGRWGNHSIVTINWGVQEKPGHVT